MVSRIYVHVKASAEREQGIAGNQFLENRWILFPLSLVWWWLGLYNGRKQKNGEFFEEGLGEASFEDSSASGSAFLLLADSLWKKNR
jgi:hypothetical protein